VSIKSWLYGETAEQRAANRTYNKPDDMTWEQWRDRDRQRRNLLAAECHWYDPREYGEGWCTGATHHDHQPRLMRWWWKGPWWVQLLVWPIIRVFEIQEWFSEAVDESWVWHKYVLRHNVVKHGAIAPDYTMGGAINVFVQDTFQRPDEHHECLTCRG
jgi:hypothetical protein